MPARMNCPKCGKDVGERSEVDPHRREWCIECEAEISRFLPADDDDETFHAPRPYDPTRHPIPVKKLSR